MSSDRLKGIGKSSDATPPEKREIVKYGISASPGIVIGKAFLKDSEMLVVPQTRLAEDQIEKEIERFQESIKVKSARKMVIKNL